MSPPVHYVEPPDVPAGMTLAEYRRSRCRPAAPRRGRWRRWRRARRGRA